MSSDELPQGTARPRPTISLAIGLSLCTVSKLLLDGLLDAEAAGWTYQMALGAGILLGIQGLGAMATAIGDQFEVLRT